MRGAVRTFFGKFRHDALPDGRIKMFPQIAQCLRVRNDNKFAEIPSGIGMFQLERDRLHVFKFVLPTLTPNFQKTGIDESFQGVAGGFF